MKTVSMSGSLRENVGKKDAKALRRQGLVPCVVYGGDNEQVQFAVKEADFRPIIFTPNTHFVELKIGDITKKTILQDIQYHPVTDRILHADFLEVFDDRPIVVPVPIKTVGVSKGVLEGGRLVKKLRKLKVKGLPGDIPEYIIIDITKLKIGSSIRIEKLNLENLECLEDMSSIAVAVEEVRKAAALGVEDEELEEGGEETEE